MQDSMYAYMKPGLVHFKAFPEVMGGQGPIVETLQKIAEDDFFTAVEIGSIKDSQVRDRARKLLEASHLTICYATQPTVLPQKLNPHSFDPVERKKVLRIIKNCVDEAYQLGASFIRVLSSKDPGDEKREEAKKLFVDFLREICQYTKDNGDIIITMKVFDRDIDKEALIGHFVDAADVTKQVVKEFNNFGVLADLSHFPLLREKPEDAIPLVKDFFMHFHLGNCVMRDKRHIAYGDLQPRFGIPGGEIDTPEVRDYFRISLNMDF